MSGSTNPEGISINTVADALAHANRELSKVSTVPSDSVGHLLNAVQALYFAVKMLDEKK